MERNILFLFCQAHLYGRLITSYSHGIYLVTRRCAKESLCVSCNQQPFKVGDIVPTLPMIPMRNSETKIKYILWIASGHYL